MCGRYQFSTHKCRELQQILLSARCSDASPIQMPEGDVAPAATVPVLAENNGRIKAVYQNWGLPGRFGRLIINARSETVCEKPMFCRNVMTRRCVIPASGYYEWDAGRHRCFFFLPDQPLYLAGLYDRVDGDDRFVILTTQPNASVRDIHNRMPLILTREQVRPWLTDWDRARQMLTVVPPLLEKRREDGQMSLDEFV